MIDFMLTGVPLGRSLRLRRMSGATLFLKLMRSLIESVVHSL